MTKLILTIIVGAFLGAFTIELLSRKRTKLFVRIRQRMDATQADLRERARTAKSEFQQAFVEGYYGSP